MGKGLLVAIGAAVLLVAGLSLDMLDSGLTWRSTKATDEQSMLAEEAARSGVTMTMSRAKREFDTWRGGLPVTPFGGGSFVTAVRGSNTGPLRVYAAGVVDGVDSQMTAWLARLAVAPAALVVQSDSVDVALGDDASISGADHTPDGEGLGQADAVHGVWASSADASDTFRDVLGLTGRNRIRGIDGNADVHQDALPGEHAALLADALGRATDSYSGAQRFTNETFGTDDDPAVVIVDGDTEFQHGGGVGLLYVRGDFSARGRFAWRGVVIQETSGGAQFTLDGSAEIAGATYLLHSAGTDDGGGDPDKFAGLDTPATHTGFGTFTDIVAWPTLDPVTVTVTQSAPAGAIVSMAARSNGSTLRTVLGRANLDGTDVGTGIPVNYTGPDPMPMLNVEPALTDQGTTTEITFTFGGALPAEPLFLYIADLDWVPMTLVARDAGGAVLSTSSWTKSLSVDLIAPDEGSRTTMRTGPSDAVITPNTPFTSDSEVIIDEVRIPDPSLIASLTLSWQTPYDLGDVAGIALATESIYAPKGRLSVTLAGDAALRYSALEIGRLARPLTSVRDRAWLVDYDHRSAAQVDRATVRSAGSTQRAATYPYCLGGRDATAPSLMDLLTQQLAGATPGACSP